MTFEPRVYGSDVRYAKRGGQADAVGCEGTVWHLCWKLALVSSTLSALQATGTLPAGIYQVPVQYMWLSQVKFRSDAAGEIFELALHVWPWEAREARSFVVMAFSAYC